MKRLISNLIGAALVTAALSGPALAGGPLANCQSGQAYKWPNGGQNIPFNPDQGDLGPVDAGPATALVAQAFQAWGNVATSTASYVNAGQLPADVTIANFAPFLNPAAPDGLSAIVFDDTGEIFNLLFGPGSGILGFAGPEWLNPATCTIIEGVSFLNGPSFTNLTAALDVMVHEFGHYSNLSHTVVNGQAVGFGDATGPSPANTFGPAPSPAGEAIETMYPFYFGPGSGTQNLNLDDRASLSTLYPEASFAANSGAISGTIFAPNGTTRLTGVNVIARNIADPFNDASSAISSDFTDSTSQADPVVGTYKIEGLTPGATYAVYVDQILAGGFSTPPLAPLPGPEEFHNGAGEGSTGDPPGVFTGIAVAAGATASGKNVIFNTPGPGDPLNVGDDGSARVFLPFVYSLCGVEYDSVFVNANGNLTFGQSNADFSESAAEMRSGPPRIAALWDDLNPGAGGTVFFRESTNSFTVHYDQVPEFFNSGSNTFSITIYRSSNLVDVQYGAMTAVDGLAGVSCGGAVTSGAEPPVNLSSYFRRLINMLNQPAVYEVFTGANPNDLAQGLLRYSPTNSYEDNWIEPNETLARARTIPLPFDSRSIIRFTEIEPTGADVDFFRFRAKAGTTLNAEIVGGQLDTVIGLFNSAGVLIDSDDDGGAGLLSKLTRPITTSGDYYLAVSAFADFDFTGDGSSGGRYILDLKANP